MDKIPRSQEGFPEDLEINGKRFTWINAPGYNDTQIAGKPLHAVEQNEHRSLCGMYRTAWAGDLFNFECCVKCQKIALKLLDNTPEPMEDMY